MEERKRELFEESKEAEKGEIERDFEMTKKRQIK